MASETATLPVLGAPRTDFDTRIVEIGFVLVLLLIMVGLSPFELRTAAAIAARDAATAAGDTVRQISFLSTFALIAFGALRKRGLQAIGAVPVLVGALLLWCLMSALWSDEPAVVGRRAVLAAIFVFSMLLSIDALGAARTLALWRGVTAAIILGDIASCLLVHGAIHQADDLEVGLTGAWRGLHSHKNMAGSVAAAATVMFFYFALETKRRSDILLCMASAFFLVMTRSKSSMGLLPVALIAGVLYRIAWRNKLDRAIAAVAAVLLMIGLTVAVCVEWEFIARFVEDPQNFTGRSAIWAAEVSYIRDHPLLGAGFGSFGNTGVRSPIYHYVGPGWVAQIGEGHSGYLEMIVTIGWVGFAIGMIGLLIKPFLEFWRSERTDANFNAMLFTLFVFDVLHNFMESDFIQVTSAQWGQILLIIGLLHASAREMRERSGLR
jgi:exopolysaccharide production protein ExoQ